MSEIDNTLKERDSRYGNYIDQAALAQSIKRAMRNSARWCHLTSDKKDALEMIAVKISRILNGDPEDYDSWHDLIGYATLIEKTLDSGEVKTNE